MDHQSGLESITGLYARSGNGTPPWMENYWDEETHTYKERPRKPEQYVPVPGDDSSKDDSTETPIVSGFYTKLHIGIINPREYQRKKPVPIVKPVVKRPLPPLPRPHVPVGRFEYMSN